MQIQLNGTIHSYFNVDPIFVISNDKLTFIETDKTIYKPGDVVKWRILMLNNDIRPIQNYNVSFVINVLIQTIIMICRRLLK